MENSSTALLMMFVFMIMALYKARRNDDAVAGYLSVTDPTLPVEWTWEELYDQAGMSEDMSFMLYTEPGCYPCCKDDYFEWLSLGKPECWCYSRQCYGDADNTANGNPNSGYYHVGIPDLILLINNWYLKEPPFGPGIASSPNGICADFAHDLDGNAKTGYVRVGVSDLNVLISNWLVREPPFGPGVPADCLECP